MTENKKDIISNVDELILKMSTEESNMLSEGFAIEFKKSVLKPYTTIDEVNVVDKIKSTDYGIIMGMM